MNPPRYLIWSIEHNAWWAPEEMGYVKEVGRAGRYEYDDALRIVTWANFRSDTPNEAMVPEHKEIL